MTGQKQYLSPVIQNKLIECTRNIIREQLVQEINHSDFLSVLADETTDTGKVQQLLLCVQYLKESDRRVFDVNEDFLGFVNIDTPDANTITQAIIENMQQWGVDMSKL